MKGILAFVVFCMWYVASQAHTFRNYQMEDGLSHNSVWAVMQDSKGFMWFGTNDGLNRFDGKSFKVYKNIPGDSLSIGSSFIHIIKELSNGMFLVGTKQGLYRFNRDRETFTEVALVKGKDKKAVVNNITEDTDGNIWISCHGQGIFVLSPQLKIKKHYDAEDPKSGLPSNFIWTLIQDKNGTIWIGSDGAGLIRLDTKEARFTSIIRDKDLKIYDKTIYSLHCDKDNMLWIGTASSGLVRYDPRIRKVDYYNAIFAGVLNIKAITAYSDTEIIMGSDKGLIVFNRITGAYHYVNDNVSFDNVSDKSVFCIERDREGAFWIGTYFSGVNYFSPDINKFSYFYGHDQYKAFKRNIISGFAEDKNGKIWIGTKDDGLSLFNPETKKFEASKIEVGYHDIQRLMLVGENLWVSLYSKGISVVNTQNNQIVRYLHKLDNPNSLTNDFVYAIFKSAAGDVYMGTSEGVSKFNPQTKTIENIKYLEKVSIKDINEDSKGNLWFGSHVSGLFRLSPSGKWTKFTHNNNDPTSISSNNVNTIYHDARKRIWVGTEGGGISLFNVDKQSFEYSITEANGLPSNIIYAILDDTDGNIWVSTGGGLAKIDPSTKKIRTFNYAESLQKIRYNLNCALRSSDNLFYFGGTNGFTVFDPRQITENVHVPQVVFTGFQIWNKEIKPDSDASPLHTSIDNTPEITLNHDQSAFSLDFVALSYLSPGSNQYAYMLEGFDTDWNYVGNNNKAYYMNIPAGKYVFKVKASNNDGVWNETGRTITIIVKPSFWLSNLMIFVYLLLAGVLIAYIVKEYKHRLEKRNEEKLYKFHAQKEKEIYESKINFFTNIAHEIRTPLSLIVAPLEATKQLVGKEPKIKDNLDIIDNNANRLIDLVNQLLDFRKVEEEMFKFNFQMQNIAEIVQKVYDQYVSTAHLKGIKMQLKMADGEISCKVDKESVYKILSNLLSNAIKHARNEITVALGTHDDAVSIAVTDDGIGIDAEYLDKIFEPFYQIENKENIVKSGSGLGLSLSKSLATKHGGQILVKSGQGKGSTFTLLIPIITDNLVSPDVADNANPNVETTTAIHLAEQAQNHQILVVEDNPDLRKFLVNNLKEHYTIYQAENGTEAIEVIEKENIDIIISDILMPEMDGIELCRRVKTNAAYSYMPFILLSAKTDVTTKIEGFEGGADVYIEKPFSVIQLKAQLQSIIENRNHIRDRFLNSPLQYYKENKDKNNLNAEFVKKLNTIILEHITDETISIKMLADEFAMSLSNMHKKVKSITGITPNEYIRLIKLNKAAQLLSTGRYKITEVCYMVGFNTPSYFSKCFFEQFKKLPKDYVQEERNENTI